MDALELLEQDHHKVKELFEQSDETDNEEQQKQIFERISSELEIHARIEETIFYPAMEKHEKLKDMVSESIKEHKEIKTLLRELTSLKADDEQFESKFEDLRETVAHHAEEEEEGKMFPKVREIVSKRDLDALGKELENAKGKQQKTAS